MVAVTWWNPRVCLVATCLLMVTTLVTFQASSTRILDQILAISSGSTLTERDVAAADTYTDTRSEEREQEREIISLASNKANGIVTIDSMNFGSLGPSGSNREKMRYYDTLFALTLQFGKHAKTVLEVGCASVPFLGHLSWIETRVCVAPYNAEYTQTGAKKEKGSHVEMIQADFYQWNASKHFDLVLCSQVLEHLPDPQAFVQKLLKVADTAIISVPYKWPKKKTPARAHHITHDIDENLFRQWTSPRTPVVTAIVSEERMDGRKDDTSRRLIMVFEKKVQSTKTIAA